ncbi:hypothetical protein C8R44DRAFT_880979 [Mycena epipterygia]|nr:hypothetical protein C8R44DRAFT_880979 [Mycena epipterygia]
MLTAAVGCLTSSGAASLRLNLGVTTIFACTWVSGHLNVPPPNQGRLVLFWHQLRMMLIAVVMLELVVALAARQIWAAQRFSQEFEKQGISITSTYGLFITMGGFVSRNGNPIVTIKQLTENCYGSG